MQNLTIQFQTADAIPAPYCYQSLAQLSIHKDKLDVKFQQHYFGREELSEDEILMEGFAPDDDFEWVGNLPAIWSAALENMLKNTTWSEEALGDNHLGVVINEEAKFPEDAYVWELFLQELMQAVHEKMGSAHPLVLRYKHIPKNGDHLSLSVQPVFHLRKVEAKLHPQKGTPVGLPMKWEQVQELLHDIFMLDYITEKASEKAPKKTGHFIDCGEGVWYELGVAVVNSSRQNDILSKVIGQFEQLAKK